MVPEFARDSPGGVSGYQRVTRRSRQPAILLLGRPTWQACRLPMSPSLHFDPLRDEGIAYARGVLNAGVNVELQLFPGTFHGSALIQHAVILQREQAETVAVLRQALAL